MLPSIIAILQSKQNNTGEVHLGLTMPHNPNPHEPIEQPDAHAVQRTEQLFHLTAALSRALTPQAVATVVLEHCLNAVNGSFGVLMQIDPTGKSLTPLAVQGLSEPHQAYWGERTLTRMHPLSDAFRRREQVWLPDQEAIAERYPQLLREPAGRNIAACTALPLMLAQNVLGVLGICFDQRRYFDPDERTFLMTITHVATQALERARLMAAERVLLASADEALALLDTVIDAAPHGIALLDTEFRYRRINPMLAQMHGLPIASHLGKRPSELFPAQAPVWEEYARHVLETGEPIMGLEVGGPQHASDKHALLDYYPIRTTGGTWLGIGIIVQDITERKRIETIQKRLLERERAAHEAEHRARTQAEEAVRLRDTFLSVAAHELKTPLTALLGQAQLLRRRLSKTDAFTATNERSIDTIIGQTKRFNDLLNDLLDGARLESGQLEITRAPFDLVELLHYVVDELRPTFSAHDLQIDVPEQPLIMLADRSRLEQVLHNLLNNAVKYSPNGGLITLQITANDDMVQLVVRDEGIGIAPEAIPHLFKHFFRAPEAERVRPDGIGIGLYIVREIVQQHGGAVTVTSTPGAGSAFSVSLPLAVEL